MTDQEIRLRCLELALEHALSTDKVAAAREFEAFVFNHPSEHDFKDVEDRPCSERLK